MDSLSEKYYSISPYAYYAGNPVNLVDPDGKDIVIRGTEEARNAYLQMLYNSTGNRYGINEENKLYLISKDDSFNGPKSESLINVINQGIESSIEYGFSLVGDNKDDDTVFIDSYDSRKVDISDLNTMGQTSVALQGAAIGHFLNEIQDPSGIFNDAHKASLNVEGKIYGELVGDDSIISRKEIAIKEPSGGFRDIEYQYNDSNRFILKQGATASEKTDYMYGIPVRVVEIINNGKLKSVKRIK